MNIVLFSIPWESFSQWTPWKPIHSQKLNFHFKLVERLGFRMVKLRTKTDLETHRSWTRQVRICIGLNSNHFCTQKLTTGESQASPIFIWISDYKNQSLSMSHWLSMAWSKMSRFGTPESTLQPKQFSHQILLYGSAAIRLIRNEKWSGWHLYSRSSGVQNLDQNFKWISGTDNQR